MHDEEIRATPQFDHERWSLSAPPLEMHRWRGNIIVKGGKKWEEDSWGEIEFYGESAQRSSPETLYVAARCARCMVSFRHTRGTTAKPNFTAAQRRS